MPRSVRGEFRVYIRERTDRPGKWTVELRPEGGKGRHGPSQTVGSKEEAEAAAEAMMLKVERGEMPDLAPAREVQDLVPEFLDRKKESKRVRSPRTPEFYKEILERRVMPALGKKAIVKLASQEIIDYTKQRLAEGRSPVTVQAEVDALAHMLDLALEKKIIKVNPARGIDVEGAKDERPKEWLHSHEIQPFLDFCSASFLPKAYAAIFLGLRRGEVIACQWGDFDFDHDVVVVRNKPEFEFRTKFGRSRSIPLWPDVRDYFIRRLTEAGRPGPEAMVFPTVSGAKYSRDTMSFAHYTAETVKRAGITRPVTKFHDLRRTFGSLCLEAGVSLEVVALWLGHRSVETTRKVYARISGRFSKDQMERVGQYWQMKREQGEFVLPPLPSGLLVGGAAVGAPKRCDQGCDQAATGCDQRKLVN